MSIVVVGERGSEVLLAILDHHQPPDLAVSSNAPCRPRFASPSSSQAKMVNIVQESIDLPGTKETVRGMHPPRSVSLREARRARFLST